MVVDTPLSESDVDRIFQALADQTRRDVLRRTIQAGESVSGLARRYSMSFAAVQKHVTVLERAALVTKERRGREQIVRADVATVQHASELLDGFAALWASRADQIAEILSAKQGEPA